MMRTLIRVTLSRGTTPQAVDRYLYGNYSITGYDPDQNWLWVEGEDRAGFTAQAIVDRLASGLIYAAVIERPILDVPHTDAEVRLAKHLDGQPATVGFGACETDEYPRHGAEEWDL